MKALAGLLLVAASAGAFYAARPEPVELAVTLDSPTSLEGHVPPELAARVVVTTEGTRAGLARRHWSVAYRGGYTREVAASALVGPFQDPAHPPCDARVTVSQHVLDGAAPVVAKALDGELAGEHFVGAGDYQGTRDVTVKWAQLVMHAEDVTFAGAAGASVGGGYVRVTATLAFQRVSVPVVVALVPELRGDALAFHAYARASVEVDGAVLGWLAHRLGGDRLATTIARDQIDAQLVETIAPPAHVALPGGGELRFAPCGPVEIHDGAFAALPFAVAIAPGAVLPPLTGAMLPPPVVGNGVALDLGVDALNALLAELWRAGTLDRELAKVGLDHKFALDPTVAEWLSLRLSPITLALPPVVETRGMRELRLAADARTTLADGALATPARIYGELAYSDGANEPPGWTLDAVELACERDRVTLVPCYTDIVDAFRLRTGDFTGVLGDAFIAIVDATFAGQRLSDPRLPAALSIEDALPSVLGGALHFELRASLE